MVARTWTCVVSVRVELPERDMLCCCMVVYILTKNRKKERVDRQIDLEMMKLFLTKKKKAGTSHGLGLSN